MIESTNIISVVVEKRNGKMKEATEERKDSEMYKNAKKTYSLKKESFINSGILKVTRKKFIN